MRKWLCKTLSNAYLCRRAAGPPGRRAPSLSMTAEQPSLSLPANDGEPSAAERRLAASLRAGSVKAFEALYRLFAARLYTFCYETIREKRETEETVHDVFMSLWNWRRNIEPERGVGQLLFAIARRRRIDAFRRLINSPVYEDYVAHQNSLAGAEGDPMEYDDFLRTFNRLLASMPPRQRSLIVMARLNGMDISEIANRLGVAEKTVRNQLSAALKELYARISPYLGDGPAGRCHPPDPPGR